RDVRAGLAVEARQVVVHPGRVRVALQRLPQHVAGLLVPLLAVQRHRLLVLLPRLLHGRDLEGVAGPGTRGEHRRAGRLRHGAAPRRRIADEYQRARRSVELVTVDGEGCVTLDDDVQLLVVGPRFRVLADHGAAGLVGAVGVD